jgi:hypothetical protein
MNWDGADFIPRDYLVSTLGIRAKELERLLGVHAFIYLRESW